MGFYRTVSTKTLDTERFEGAIFEDIVCEHCGVINYNKKITTEIRHSEIERLRKKRDWLIFTDTKTEERDRYESEMYWECNGCGRHNSIFERIDKYGFENLKDRLEEVTE